MCFIFNIWFCNISALCSWDKPSMSRSKFWSMAVPKQWSHGTQNKEMQLLLALHPNFRGPNPSFSQLIQCYLYWKLSQLQPMSCSTCLQYKPVAAITCCAYYAQVTYHLQVKSDSMILHDSSTHEVRINIIWLILQLFHHCPISNLSVTVAEEPQLMSRPLDLSRRREDIPSAGSFLREWQVLF